MNDTQSTTATAMTAMKERPNLDLNDAMSNVAYAYDISAAHIQITTDILTDSAVAWLRRQRGGEGAKPFFLVLAHPMPHMPLFRSPAFEGRSAAGVYGDVVMDDARLAIERVANTRALAPAQFLTGKMMRLTAPTLKVVGDATLTDQILKAFVFEVSKQMSVYVGLIITNCIVLGRQEAFASRQPVGRSILDALGNGAGFTIALLLMGIPREVLGSGTFLGVQVMPSAFEPWVVMLLPPGGFFMIGVLLLVANWHDLRRRPLFLISVTLIAVLLVLVLGCGALVGRRQPSVAA